MPLTPFERAHAESILDPHPTVEPIPSVKPIDVVIGAVIRKPPEVIGPWLRSLEDQRTDDRVTTRYHFILDLHGTPYAQEVGEMIYTFVNANEGSLVQTTEEWAEGSYGDGPKTRQWTETGFRRMGDLKNQIIQHALNTHADYLWLVDADVFCDPRTLHALLASEAGVVAAVYWTEWSRPDPNDAQHQHAGPQVWLRHPYHLSGRGWTEPAFRAALVNRQRIEVGGLGACTLFAASTLRKGVHFGKTDTLPPGPMSDGEDRHLCARAAALHVPLIADAWPTVYHAYHPTEYDRISDALNALRRSAELEGPPRADDLVNIKLTNLEANVPPQYIRGVLCQLALLPDIANAVAGMKRGESRPVKVHFPAHFPNDAVRGRSCIIQVTLIDLKPNALPPEIDKEWIWSQRSLSGHDSTTLTREQITDLVGEPERETADV